MECPPILYPQTQNCSGRGVCLSATTCLCPEGWTGQGDFAFDSPNCDINLSAIRGLWAMLAVSHLFTILWIIFYFKKKYGQRSRPVAPIVLGVLFLCSSTCLMITGLIRSIQPLRTIGSDVTVTVFFCLGTAVFWTGCTVFINIFLELALKQSRIGGSNNNVAIMFARLRGFFPLSICLEWIACLILFGMLNAQSEGAFYGYAATHYLFSAFVMNFCYVYCRVYIGGLSKELQANIKANPGKSAILKIIVWKLDRCLLELRNQGAVNIIFALFFGIWPFLQVVGSSYFLPFAWMSAAAVTVLLTFVNLPAQDKASSHSEVSSNILPHGSMKLVTSPVPTVAASSFQTSMAPAIPPLMESSQNVEAGAL